MIPKDLLYLISKYNEIGIFFAFNDYIYWFNGKQIKKWCENVHDLTMLNIDNGYLYGHNNFDSYHLENLKFTKISWKNMQLIKDQKTKIVYDYKLGFFADNIALPLKNHRRCGIKLLQCDSNLYYFGSSIHEIFNIKTNKWSNLMLPNETLLVDVALFQNLFYLLYENGTIATFDPIFKIWQETSFNLATKNLLDFHEVK